jgi:hypothetical protein
MYVNYVTHSNMINVYSSIIVTLFICIIDKIIDADSFIFYSNNAVRNIMQFFFCMYRIQIEQKSEISN